ncbi:hypothetical protein POTOM_019707 [Populus tomentosa]|uniref:Uncharacterized protein n=1 Tax=Populus tomentosa TaxID=118781 RepID=A0A8X7ZW28_POPTO|nr:hypothetical protein POTOM_019707 [Populus tomentosa]
MAEEKHHHGLFHHNKSEEKPVEAGVYSETAEYSETVTGYDAPVPDVDYRKEEKHHKNLEHVGELGAAAAGAFAMYEKHEAKKDPEHAHRHKIEEEIAAAAAVGTGGFGFHEHHEKKETKKEEEEANGKKHHHF